MIRVLLSAYEFEEGLPPYFDESKYAYVIDLLAILQKSLDRAILLYNFIREA